MALPSSPVGYLAMLLVMLLWFAMPCSPYFWGCCCCVGGKCEGFYDKSSRSPSFRLLSACNWRSLFSAFRVILACRYVEPMAEVTGAVNAVTGAFGLIVNGCVAVVC